MLEVKDKAAALKFTRVAQVLFVVAGGAAAAVVFMGGPRSSASSPNSYKPKDPIVSLPSEKTAADLDIAGAAARFAMIGNAPRPVPPPEPSKPPEGTGQIEEPPKADVPKGPDPSDPVQYFGPVRLGARTLALLSIHGKQRFAALNESTDDGVVTEITSEHVTLSLRDIERKVERAAKTTDVLTKVTGVGAPKGMMPRTAAIGQIRPAMPTAPQPMVQPIQPPIVQTNPTDPAARYDDIRTRLKSTGMYQNDEELTSAAKGELERQMMNGKPPQKSPK